MGCNAKQKGCVHVTRKPQCDLEMWELNKTENEAIAMGGWSRKEIKLDK